MNADSPDSAAALAVDLLAALRAAGGGVLLLLVGLGVGVSVVLLLAVGCPVLVLVGCSVWSTGVGAPV